MTSPQNSTVLVYGTNMAGYRAIYALGKLGYKSILLNRGSYVDEVKNQVLSQLPMDLCWACAFGPQRMFIGLGALQVFYNSELVDIQGEPGNFKVKFKKKDPYVNNFICTECNKCFEVCPEGAIKIIPKIFWENIYYIDEDKCTKCGKCEEICPTGALKLNKKLEEVEAHVGAIYLTPEYVEPEKGDLEKFGFKKFKNVLKNNDIVSSGVTTSFILDSIKRKSDGKIPKSFAIIVTPQYNSNEFEDCNTTNIAVYRAIKLKELIPDAEVTVFFKNYRGFGKGHYKLYLEARDIGVKIVKADDVFFKEIENNNIEILHKIADRDKVDIFELVILVTGQKPPINEVGKLEKICGIKGDNHGFCYIEPFSNFKTGIDGIFAGGEFKGPLGNPETVWEGYGVVPYMLDYLGAPVVAPPKPPAFKDVSTEPVKVGVFLCSCFGKFFNKIDLEKLKDEAEKLPYVSHVEIIDSCCTPPMIGETAKKIRESGVNRVILAVCTPLQKLMKFRKAVMMGGLNPLLSEFLRLREDIVNVHDNKEKKLEKALSLIRAASLKLKYAQAFPGLSDSFTGNAVVIGGGVGGMESAIRIAKRGIKVSLIEKADKLGGTAYSLYSDIEGRDLKEFVESQINEVNSNENIKVYLNTDISMIQGYAGNFKIIIDKGEILDAGAIFIATGAKLRNVNAYFYKKNPNVFNQADLEKAINENKFNKKSIVIIQCVGSRNKNVPYCSRICCSQALKSAIRLRKKGVDVTILYRDLKLYGFKEDYYKEALNKGVNFIRFNDDNYPVAEQKGEKFKIKVKEYCNEKEHILESEAIGISVGIVPDIETNEKLAKMTGLKLYDNGFFALTPGPYEEAAKKLMKPFELQTNGVFPIGMALSPRTVDETLLTARQSAGQSLIFLNKKALPAPNGVFVSAIDETKCVGCGYCVDVCPYNARALDPITKKAIVHPFLCDNCGACVVACPSGASYLRDLQDRQMISSIDALLG
jgi:heterodisulfide reductase subunit A